MDIDNNNITRDFGVNFYELKTQLADLGFSEPGVIDQLREIVLSNEIGLPAIELIKAVDKEEAYFTLFFGRDPRGLYELTCFDCSLHNLTVPGYRHMQYFHPDVPAAAAIIWLEISLKLTT